MFDGWAFFNFWEKNVLSYFIVGRWHSLPCTPRSASLNMSIYYLTLQFTHRNRKIMIILLREEIFTFGIMPGGKRSTGQECDREVILSDVKCSFALPHAHVMLLLVYYLRDVLLSYFVYKTRNLLCTLPLCYICHLRTIMTANIKSNHTNIHDGK